MNRNDSRQLNSLTLINLPPRNLLLCYRVIADAGDADLAAARAARQPLIAPVFA